MTADPAEPAVLDLAARAEARKLRRPGEGLFVLVVATNASRFCAVYDRHHKRCYHQTGNVMRFERITVDPLVATGKPCIRHLRFPVSRLLGLLAAGETKESILAAYPYLEAADIDESLLYAASLAEDETVELAR